MTENDLLKLVDAGFSKNDIISLGSALSPAPAAATVQTVPAEPVQTLPAETVQTLPAATVQTVPAATVQTTPVATGSSQEVAGLLNIIQTLQAQNLKLASGELPQEKTALQAAQQQYEQPPVNWHGGLPGINTDMNGGIKNE